MKLQLAGCIIEDHTGRILLLHRNTPDRQQWEIPGGKVGEGEDPASAAKRELKEELGIEVEIVNEIGRKDFTEDGRKMGYIWYKAKIVSGIPAPREGKHDKTEYFSFEQLKSMQDLSPNTNNLIDHLNSED